MMRIRVMAVIVVMASLVAASAADAAAKRGKRHARAATPAMQAHGYPIQGVRQGPAHMIEARPGVWISSYGCITDEGYGRYTFCDRREGN